MCESFLFQIACLSENIGRYRVKTKFGQIWNVLASTSYTMPVTYLIDFHTTSKTELRLLNGTVSDYYGIV